MTISDNSGIVSSRDVQQRTLDERLSGGDTARFLADSGGSGGGGGSNSGGDKPNPPPSQPSDPFGGAKAGGETRPCDYITWYEEWHTAEDERVCPECAPLDGVWYEQFKGPQPPLHDHCRCWRELVWWDCYTRGGEWVKGGSAVK